MANALIISKQTGGYFSFNLSIDGVPQDEVRSIQNDLLTVGNTLHFKTSNGANIIKQQNIVPAELTIIASGTFTFATVTQVWDKLIEVGFFDWLGTGGGAGVDRFDDLLDTFQYFGKDGYVCVVNESQQKLEAVPFYNYRKFTQLEDAPSYLVPNKMVVVNPAGTSLILQDQPPSPDTYLNSVGYFDYNDSVTHTTPLTFVASTPKKLTNDTLGVNTNTSQNPYGVSYVWNSTTNQFDFSQLSIGDTVDIRIQVQVTTTTANQKYKITGKFGIGSVAQFENTILSSQVKTAGLEEISFVAPFYIGSTYIRDFPAELYLTSDNGGTVVVDGWYVRILRKNINIITIESTVSDATTLAKGIVRLGGDLAGTADNPTVPALATKIGSSRLINTTAPLSGGGDLSLDRTLSIAQSNTSTDGYLTGGDWTTFNSKQAGNANLTSVSSLSYVSPAFVKMTGLNTFTLDTNTYLTSTTGVTTFSTGTTGLTPSTATSGAITLNGTLVVANGGTGSTTASGARTNLGGTTVGSNIFTSTNPTAITFLRANADNTVSWLDATTFRTAIGAGTSSTVGTVTSVSALTLGTTGTDLSSTVATGTTTPVITLNVPNASATNRGVLTSTDWSTFNGKQNALTNPITGIGTTNTIPKFTGLNTLGDSILKEVASLSGNTGSNIFLGTTAETARDARFYSNIPSVLTNYGGHTFGDYTPISQTVGGDGSSAYASFDAKAIMSGSGAFNHFLAFQARNEFTGSGTLSSMEGVRTAIVHNGSGTVTDAIGVSIFSKQGTGVVTNLYGIKISSQSGATNNYALYTDSGLVRFGDNVSSTGTFSGTNYNASNVSGNGYKLYNSEDYKIYMASATDATNGGRISGETTSDFNMYFKMSNVNNRGFYFKSGATPTVVAGIDYLGNVRANSFVKLGGTSAQYLMADGTVSTLTNPITGTGTNGYVSFWNGTNTQSADSNLFWDNTNKRLGLGTVTPIGKVNIFTGSASLTDFNIPSQQNGSISFANVSATASVPSIIGKSNDDSGILMISATNDINSSADFRFNARQNTNADFTTLSTPAFRFTRFTTNLVDILRNGNVLIGTTTDDGANKLQVNGSGKFLGSLTADIEVQAGSNTQTGAGLIVNGASGSIRTISMRTAGSRRWGWRMDNTAESGSNAGSDLRLTSYVDAGTQLSDVLFVKRSTGNIGIGTTTDDGVNKLQVNGNIALLTNYKLILGSNQAGGASLMYNSNGNLDITPRSGYNTSFTSGIVNISNLSGTGTRTVVADASGNLSTSTTSNPNYKVYTALLTQTGTSAPTATILENTIGSIVWTRNSAGNYIGTLTGAFTNNKSTIQITSTFASVIASGYRVSADAMSFMTSTSGTNSDNAITNGTLEIRVYN